MMNPTVLMKLMGAKNKFESGHPKFSAFLQRAMAAGIQEGTVVEITITRPDGNAITGNMRVTAQDMELVEELKNLSSTMQ